ncbi:MAG TPA: hypothetical protein VKA68_05785 [bacterium]|nr:hypothetical protein [bacterium]
MRRFIYVLVILAMAVHVKAQQLTVRYQGQTVPVRQVSEDSWEITLDGTPYILLLKSDLADLAKKAELQQAEIERHEKVIEALNNTIEKYETYRKAADQHIQTQKALINTADSLYKGYQSLYQDLKRFAGLSPLAVIGGAGVINPPNSGIGVVGSLGVRYQNWIGQYQFGKGYQGFMVGVQYSFGQ